MAGDVTSIPPMLAGFHPLVSQWFEETFGQPSDPQRSGWPAIASVMAASDPANVYNLPLELIDRDPLSRPRGSGALLVMPGGRVAIAVEGRGRRYSVADWLIPDEVIAAKQALIEHLRGERSARYVV